MSRPPPPNPAMPYREDCWSEGATSTLIDAWGGRYLELSRGNLRQKDWQEVADSVNSRAAAAKRPPRTDSQCKNRIDTLKKKYKAERSRISDSNGALDSRWQFYPRLDVLIGAAPSPAPAAGKNPPLALPLPSNRKASPLPIALALNDSLRRNYSAAAAAAAASANGDSSSSASSSREIPAKRRRGRHEDEDEDGIRKLADAITGFAEIYEKVEGEKQRQTLEMEERRLEFTKGVELQRMQAFVDSQIQMKKLKRAGRDDAASTRLSQMMRTSHTRH